MCKQLCGGVCVCVCACVSVKVYGWCVTDQQECECVGGLGDFQCAERERDCVNHSCGRVRRGGGGGGDDEGWSTFRCGVRTGSFSHPVSEASGRWR